MITTFSFSSRLMIILLFLNVNHVAASNSWQALMTFDLLDETSAPSLVHIEPVDDTASFDWLSSPIIDVLANDNVSNVLVSPTVTKAPENGITQVINGKIKYTPNIEYIGDDYFEYWVESTDGTAITSSVARVDLHVVDIDRGTIPVVSDDISETMGDDAAIILNVLLNDTDVDGAVLIIESITEPESGSVLLLANGAIQYQPNAGYCGSDSFSYVVRDERYNRISGNVTVTCNPPPSIPRLLFDVLEVNSALRIQQEYLILTEDNFYDRRYSLDELRIQFNSQRTYDDIADVDRKDTAYGYVSAFNSIEPHRLKYKNKILYLSREQDGTAKIDEAEFRIINPEGNVSNWAKLRISLDDAFESNYDYFPADDAVTVPQGDSININVLDNDPDVRLYYDVKFYRYPANGSLKVNADKKTLEYIPNPGFVGQDKFKYKVVDELGSINSAPAEVIVQVISNESPIANNDVLHVKNNTLGGIIDVIANDTDIENDPIYLLSASTAQYGTVTVETNRTVKYVPHNYQCTNDSFSYVVTQDEQGILSDIGNVQVICDTPESEMTINQFEWIPASVPVGVSTTFYWDIANADKCYAVSDGVNNTLARAPKGNNGQHIYSEPREHLTQWYCLDIHGNRFPKNSNEFLEASQSIKSALDRKIIFIHTDLLGSPIAETGLNGVVQ